MFITDAGASIWIKKAGSRKGYKHMQFTFAHNNFNVLNLKKSLAFYKEALQLKEVRRYEPPDGSFILVFLGEGTTPHQLELTWMKDRKERAL
jgi:lactoylglutathione lyase